MTPETFDRLLAWLNPERELAGREYVEIYSSLVTGFRNHRCTTPEDLADKTVNRVAMKLPEIESAYVGERAPYFHRVAHYIHLEYLREAAKTLPLTQVDLPQTDDPPDGSLEELDSVDEFLEHCLQQQSPRDRSLIMEFYSGDKADKIRRRKELAARLGINVALLRTQAHRIRERIKKCIESCLKQKAACNGKEAFG